MRCEEIMERDVECASPETTAQEAARRMRDQDIGFLPVCESSGKAIGALTDRDIAVRLVADGLPGTTHVSELLTREVVACRPEDDVREAERLMKEKQVQRLMVIDGSGGLVGVISLRDLVKEEDQAVASTIKSIKSEQPIVH